MKKALLMPYKMQFFGEDGGGNDTPPTTPPPGTDSNANTPPRKSDEELRKEGQNALLSLLGFKDEDEAKKAVNLYTAMVNSQLTPDEVQKKESEKAEAKIKEALERAAAAENKLACLTAGVQADSIEDVLAIASLRVTKDKDLATVIGEMKKNDKYSGFFNSENNGGVDNQNNTTGTPPGHAGDNNSGGKSLGAQLGESLSKKRAGTNVKRSFF